MGLSISVLVAVFLFLPGAALIFGHSKLHRLGNPVTPVDQFLSIGLAVAFVSSALLHAIWLSATQILCLRLHCPPPDLTQVFALLSGNMQDPQSVLAVKSLQEYPGRIIFYFLTLCAAAFGLGRLVNFLSKSDPHLSWPELLRPSDQEIELVWVTIDININSKCYFYTGWIRAFTVSKDGTLEKVVFGWAARKEMLQPPKDPKDFLARQAEDLAAEDSEDIEDGWQEIPGEAFVLLLKDAKTVNIDYFFKADKHDVPAPETVSAVTNDPAMLPTSENSG